MLLKADKTEAEIREVEAYYHQHGWEFEPAKFAGELDQYITELAASGEETPEPARVLGQRLIYLVEHCQVPEFVEINGDAITSTSNLSVLGKLLYLRDQIGKDSLFPEPLNTVSLDGLDNKDFGKRIANEAWVGEVHTWYRLLNLLNSAGHPENYTRAEYMLVVRAAAMDLYARTVEAQGRTHHRRMDQIFGRDYAVDVLMREGGSKAVNSERYITLASLHKILDTFGRRFAKDSIQPQD